MKCYYICLSADQKKNRVTPITPKIKPRTLNEPPLLTLEQINSIDEKIKRKIHTTTTHARAAVEQPDLHVDSIHNKTPTNPPELDILKNQMLILNNIRKHKKSKKSKKSKKLKKRPTHRSSKGHKSHLQSSESH